MTAIDPNPYAPPTADVDAGLAEPALDGALAGRAARLFARLYDWALYAVLIVATYGALAERPRGGAFSAVNLVVSAAGVLGVLGLFVFQAYRVSTTGQTLGKKRQGVRIVKLDGSPVDFASGFLVRSFVIHLLTGIPLVGPAFAVVDCLFVFRSDRRCIHDLIAGTKVIDVRRAP